MNLNETKQKRDQFGSKIGFVLAAAGSAIGLGNIWRFPFMAGQNGGGAFVLLYCGILIVLGFTLMMAEITVGRHTQLSPVGAYKKLHAKWAWVGGLGVLAGFLILSFYSVIGGWVIRYFVSALSGQFGRTATEEFAGVFSGFISSPVEPIIYHAIFMILTLGIVIGGVKGGIEKYSKILMPALLVMMVLTMIRSLTLPGAIEGVKFMFVPDFSKINGTVFLAALGQVFFSLSLGMGAMMTYGSYLDKESNILESSIQIPLLDTAIALVAGLAILPAVFALGFNPSAGPSLLFITLPAVFSQMPLGGLFGVVFFLLVLFAALTSSISLLEVCVAYVVDEFKWNRKTASIALGAIIFVLGIPSSLGQAGGLLAHITPFRGLSIQGSVDFIASKLLLPIGGMLLCIFIGWVWGVDNAVKEITNDGKINFRHQKIWGFLVKWVAPIAIAVVLYQGLK